MNTIANEIAESMELTREAVHNEMFCLELATIMCSPEHCGTIDVAQCVTNPTKFILVKYLKSGNKLHICIDNGSVEIRVVDGRDGRDNIIKCIVPECQTVLRNAITTYVRQVKELKKREESEAMDAVSAEIDAEIASLGVRPVAQAPVSQAPVQAAPGVSPMLRPMPVEESVRLAKVIISAIEAAKPDKPAKPKKSGKAKKAKKDDKGKAPKKTK